MLTPDLFFMSVIILSPLVFDIFVMMCILDALFTRESSE